MKLKETGVESCMVLKYATKPRFFHFLQGLYRAHCTQFKSAFDGKHPMASEMKDIMKTCPCNIQRFLALKIENLQLKNFDIFLIFAQNIDCGYTLEPPRRGGSNEYPQSMFWSKNKKNR